MPVRVFKAEMAIETDGNVDLRRHRHHCVPDNLSVGGSPYLHGTGITALPENLSVGGRVIGFEPPAPSG
jgi:hypothetical protein